MKKFMQFVAAVKAVATLAFAAQIMIVTVLNMLLGRDNILIAHVWQMMFLSLIYGCLQLLAFSDNYFKDMKTPNRIALLGVSMLVVLAVFAVIFNWFPTQNPINWLIFAGLYIIFFLVCVFALRTVFRLSGIRYNQMLAAYNANINKDPAAN